MKKLAAILLTVVTVFSSVAALAQDYPGRPITMVVPYAAGGSTDVLARILAEIMTRDLKQPVVVENAGGAGGTVGSGRVAKAAPNGYTLLFHNMGLAAAPALYRNLSFDPIADFEPIGLVADVPMILVGRKDLPPTNLTELIAYARANRDKLTFAHSGAGSTAHLCAMLFMSTIQTELTSVPYRGTGPALQDLIGGQVDLLCDQPVSTVGHIQGKLLKAYALANKTRIPILPNVPTFSEAGLPGFELAVWHGLYSPKGTPQPVLQRLNLSLQRALADPALIQKFSTMGTAPVEASRVTAQALSTHLKAQINSWGPIIKKAGAYAD